MNIKAELLAIVDALAAAEIEHAIVGGLAVAIYGCPRLTMDIDIIIRESDLDRARQTLAPTGFDLESGILRFPVSSGEDDRIFRLTKTEGTEFLTLDLLLAGARHEAIWGNRELFQFGHRRVWVVSRDDLIAMKRQAGRPKDLADLAALQAELPPA